MSLKVVEEATMLSPETGDRPRYHSFQSGTGHRITGKDILVFCDGTGKDGMIGTNDKTNVWRLYQLAISKRDKGNGAQAGWARFSDSTLRQNEIAYFSGVGSGSSRNPYNLLARVFGSTIVENIVQAYLHITKHYEAGSKIYLFGYSRGAFVVRKVASLLYRLGIIREREEMLKLWDRHQRPVPWNLIDSPPRGSAIHIEALAVWDTVGAIRSVRPKSKMEGDILGMEDEELPPNVRHTFHVVAFHENRKLFRVTLFKPDPRQENKLKEVWFPGAHYEVGGGDINKVGLPNISLIWVIGELQVACALPVLHDDLEYPPDIEKLKPSNAYRDSPKWKRLVDKCEPRIRLLTKKSLIHETVIYLKNAMPTNLDPRSKPKGRMLTINDLGSIGWDIKACLVARNAIESLKHANAVARDKLEEQAALFRNRVNSLHVSRTPRSSLSSIDRITGNGLSKVPTLASTGPSITVTPPITRHRAESHALPRSSSLAPSRTAPISTGLHVHPGGIFPFQDPIPGARRPTDPSASSKPKKDRANEHSLPPPLLPPTTGNKHHHIHTLPPPAPSIMVTPPKTNTRRRAETHVPARSASIISGQVNPQESARDSRPSATRRTHSGDNFPPEAYVSIISRAANEDSSSKRKGEDRTIEYIPQPPSFSTAGNKLPHAATLPRPAQFTSATPAITNTRRRAESHVSVRSASIVPKSLPQEVLHDSRFTPTHYAYSGGIMPLQELPRASRAAENRANERIPQSHPTASPVPPSTSTRHRAVSHALSRSPDPVPRQAPLQQPTHDPAKYYAHPRGISAFRESVARVLHPSNSDESSNLTSKSKVKDRGDKVHRRQPGS